MPMIVSGLDPSVRMNAYLAGAQLQQRLKQQQDAAQAAQAERMDRYAAEMRDAMLRTKKEQAKALEDANARAQMGDVQAMRTQDMEATAAKLPPKQQRLMEYAKMRKNVTNPEALKELDRGYADLEDRIQKNEQREAALQVIETAENDGLVPAGEGQQRLASGEEPETIAKEYAVKREKQAQAATAMQESADALAEAEQLLQAAPKGSNSYKRALHVIQFFKGSPTAQQTPGAADRFLKQVKDTLILSAGEEREMERAKKRRISDTVIPGSGGQKLAEFQETVEGQTPTLGVMSPDTPPLSPDYAKYAEGLKAEKEKRYPGSTKKSLNGKKAEAAQKTDEEIIQDLIASGVPLTPENILAAGGLGGPGAQ